MNLWWYRNIWEPFKIEWICGIKIFIVKNINKLRKYFWYIGITKLVTSFHNLVSAVVLWLSDSPRDGELTVVRLSPLSGSSDYRLGKNSPISYKKVTMSPNENNRSCETASVITGWWNSFFVKYQQNTSRTLLKDHAFDTRIDINKKLQII